MELSSTVSTGNSPIKNGKEPALTAVMLTTTALRLPDQITTTLAMELFAETAEIAANDLGGTTLGFLPSPLPTDRCGRFRGASRGLATSWEEVMQEPPVRKDAGEFTDRLSVTPQDSITYSLTAAGPGGTQIATARVTVTTPPPPPQPPSAAPALSEEELFNQNVKDAYFDFDKADIGPDAEAALLGTESNEALWQQNRVDHPRYGAENKQELGR